MIQELLVLMACIQNQGCNQTTNLYFKNNPSVEQMVKHKEKLAMNYLAPTVIEVAPYVLITATGKGSFRLNKSFNLQIYQKSQQVLILYHLDF